MKQEELFSVIGNVDESYISDARPQVRKRSWGRWAALAASLCLVAGIGMGIYVMPGAGEQERPTTAETEEQAAVGFMFNGAFYFPIDFESRIRFGLVPENAAGLTKENTYQITGADLGEVMGTAELDGKTATLYHFASYPDLDVICIVEVSGKYAFYTAEGLVLEEDAQQTSDGILDSYHMPDSVSEITVLTGDWETVLTITDWERIEAICAILRGKTDMGLAEHEKLFAKLWYDTYGNEAVYYNEDTGSMVYQSGLTGPPKQTTVTDAEGNSVTYVEPDTVFEENYDAAHALWGEGERVLRFTVERGFQFDLIYTPSIKTVSMYDGYYALSDEEAAQMNVLLEIA